MKEREELPVIVKQLGGSAEDLRNVLCGVIELFGVEGAANVTSYALKHRGTNAFDGSSVVASPKREETAEPVAWRWRWGDGGWHFGPNRPMAFRFGNPDEAEPLYASPPIPPAEAHERGIEAAAIKTGIFPDYVRTAIAAYQAALSAKETSE